MKSVALIALLFATPLIAVAQMTNGGFEEWEDLGGEVPVGWWPPNVGLEKDTLAYSGNYSARIRTWYSSVAGDLEITVPMDPALEKLIGYYKFDRGHAPDTAYAMVVLSFMRYDSALGRSLPVGSTKQYLMPSEEWAPFEMAIPSPPSETSPDSILIGFHSSDSRIRCTPGPSGGQCCFVNLDDIALVTSSGVAYPIESLVMPPQVLPNPVVEGTARLRFNGEEGERYRVLVHDASGALAFERDVIGFEADLPELQLPSGAYFISIHDAADVRVAVGRFVVE